MGRHLISSYRPNEVENNEMECIMSPIDLRNSKVGQRRAEEGRGESRLSRLSTYGL